MENGFYEEKKYFRNLSRKIIKRNYAKNDNEKWLLINIKIWYLNGKIWIKYGNNKFILNYQKQ